MTKKLWSFLSTLALMGISPVLFTDNLVIIFLTAVVIQIVAIVIGVIYYTSSESMPHLRGLSVIAGGSFYAVSGAFLSIFIVGPRFEVPSIVIYSYIAITVLGMIFPWLKRLSS